MQPAHVPLHQLEGEKSVSLARFSSPKVSWHLVHPAPCSFLSFRTFSINSFKPPEAWRVSASLKPCPKCHSGDRRSLLDGGRRSPKASPQRPRAPGSHGAHRTTPTLQVRELRLSI